MVCPNKASCPHLGCADACDAGCQQLCGQGLVDICNSRCPHNTGNPLLDAFNSAGNAVGQLSSRVFGNPGAPTSGPNAGIIPNTLQGAGNDLSSAGQGAGSIFGKFGGTGPFGLPWVVLLAGAGIAAVVLILVIKK